VTALLVVDQQPFLKKALSTCKRLRSELHKKQKLLADFEECDRSAYQQWYHANHGAELTQIREARDEVSEYQFIIYQLNHAAHRDYKTVPALYEELMQRKKDGTLHAYEPPQREADADDIFDDDVEWDEDFGDDDAARRFYEDMHGDDHGADSSEYSSPHPSPGKSGDDARLKTCYRNLAKRLHPDHSELEEAVREKRWHEIQDAYHQGDLEALLRVEAICDMDATGLTLKLGLARLRDLAAYHKSHLIPLRNALRAAKRDVAFGFAAKGASPAMKREVAGELRFEREGLAEHLSYLNCAAKGIYQMVQAEIREDEARAAHAKSVADIYSQKTAPPKVSATNPRRRHSDPSEYAEQMSFF